MGIFDSIVSAATGGAEHAQVASGLMDQLQQQPGGAAGLLQSFQQNGLGGLVQQWAGGQTSPASPDQVEQGLAGTGIIDSIAQRTGMSPTVIKGALAILIPLIVHHLVSNGHVTPDGQPTGAPPPDTGGLLQSILAKIV